MINMMSQQMQTISTLKKDVEEWKTKEASQKKEEDDTPILGGSRLMLTQGPTHSAPSPQPTGMGYGGMNGVATQPTGYRAF
jgi:clathrin heavy chain